MPGEKAGQLLLDAPASDITTRRPGTARSSQVGRQAPLTRLVDEALDKKRGVSRLRGGCRLVAQCGKTRSPAGSLKTASGTPYREFVKDGLNGPAGRPD